MYKILMMSLVLLGFAAAPAHAQNMGNRDNAVDYTGAYLGVTGGYSWSDVDVDATIGGVSLSDSASVDGWQGGVLGGYGYQFGQGYDYVWNGYVGVELSYEWSGADDSVFGVDVEKNDVMNISLRPGFTWGDTALGYGIIGYSRAQFEAGGDDDWVDGFALGLGTELGEWGPVKGRLEYVHTWYQDQDYTTAVGTVSSDLDDDAVKAGLIYRF
ncbi:MAG TPA: outer membrane beta-barrel protein [Micavibrio sp.]